MTTVAVPTRCGTNAGWNVHMRANEKPCDRCEAAKAGYQTAWRHRRTVARKPPRCGTESGLIGHWTRDENPCELCQSWNRAYRHALTLGPVPA